MGIFVSIGKSYLRSSGIMFSKLNDFGFFMILAFPLAVVVAPLLLAISAIYFMFLPVDLISAGINWIRVGLLDSIEEFSAEKCTFVEFLLHPIWMVMFSVIFLFAAFLPKISSEILDHEASEIFLEEITDLSGAWVFRNIGFSFFFVISSQWEYLRLSPWLFAVLLFPIWIAFLPFNCLFGIIFFLLLPLDLISWVVESSRRMILATITWLGDWIEQNLVSYVICSVFLIIMAPIAMAVIVVPKFSGGID